MKWIIKEDVRDNEFYYAGLWIAKIKGINEKWGLDREFIDKRKYKHFKDKSTKHCYYDIYFYTENDTLYEVNEGRIGNFDRYLLYSNKEGNARVVRGVDAIKQVIQETNNENIKQALQFILNKAKVKE